MDLNAVKIFVRTAELRSFTDAASVLKMTQSGVSRAVSRLESNLGVKLMNRTTRSLSLTPDGQAFFERCSLLLSEFDDAEYQLTEQQERPSGVLKISSPVGFGRSVLLPVLTQLSRKYPSLIVEASMTDRMVDLVAEGFDAAIRIGTIPDSRIVARRLNVVRLVTIASPAYLERFGTPKSPDDLLQHNCLNMRLPRTGRLYEWRFVENGREHRLAVTGNIILDSSEGLLDLVVQGHGIVQAQRFIAAQALANKQVVAVLEEYVADRGPISLIYPQGRHLSSKIRALRNELLKVDF